jgi:hypothetical protein
MKYEFVTSMHKPYFDHIGRVMLESWLHYWNRENMTLTIYAEEFDYDFNDKRIIWKDWRKHCESNHKIFVEKSAGITPGSSARFAKKGFAFLDAMKKTSADRLVWLDADLLFFKTIDYERFDRLLDDKKLIAFFDQFYATYPEYTHEQYTDKESRKLYGAESGFVVLNPKHSNYKQYVENYKSLFLEGSDRITHWYDSEVVVLAARDFLNDVFDLSSLRTTNKTQTPLNRCWLTEYFNHQKAKSKSQYSIKELRDLCGLGEQNVT